MASETRRPASGSCTATTIATNSSSEDTQTLIALTSIGTSRPTNQDQALRHHDPDWVVTGLDFEEVHGEGPVTAGQR